MVIHPPGETDVGHAALSGVRVLAVNPSDDSYGIDRVFLSVVEALRAAGSDVSCSLERDNVGNGWLADSLVRRQFPTSRQRLNYLSRRDASNPLRLTRWLFGLLRALPRMVSLARAHDLVYVNGFTLVATAIAARIAARKVIWHLHEIPPSGPALGRLVRILSSQQICVSKAVADAFGLSAAPSCSVVYNAVDAPDTAANQNPVDAGHPLEIGIVARINRGKGHLILAEAFGILVNDGLPVRLHVVGAPHPSDRSTAIQLEDRLCQLPAKSIVRAGESPNGASYMQRLHVLAAPSVRPDPFPLSVLEGMAAGLVVVASDTGGHPEAVTDDVTGLLFRSGDAQDLASKLRELITDVDRRRRIATAARQQIIDHFSPDAFSKAVQRITARAQN